MLFDWLVIGQAMPTNPAHSVRGPRHSVTKGSTPVLSSEDATALLTGMYVSTVVGLHDRAIIAVMTYIFARVGPSSRSLSRITIRKKTLVAPAARKNGKLNEMPCHHKLEEYLDAYIIKTAGITNDRKGPLFRSASGKTAQLSARAMQRGDVSRMVRRRASDAGIETAIARHTFRATGITDYPTNGGRIEVAQRMARHSNAKTTGLHDRRNDDISVGEVERGLGFDPQTHCRRGDTHVSSTTG